MQENTENTKITACCPSGHRVRGDISYAGNTVRCPKCQATFIFAPLRAESPRPPAVSPNRGVTDTGVMRILGEAPAPAVAAEAEQAATRPCPRCKVSISANLTVCDHCNVYVGVMPRFMSELTGRDSGGINTN